MGEIPYGRVDFITCQLGNKPTRGLRLKPEPQPDFHSIFKYKAQA